MIRKTICLGVLIAACIGSASAQAPGDTLEVLDILDGLSTGDADGVLAQAAERVELALLSQPRRYSRVQAQHVLDDFFQQHPPGGFDLAHSMSQGGEWWLTGRYTVLGYAERLRVYVRLAGDYPAYEVVAIQVVKP